MALLREPKKHLRFCIPTLVMEQFYLTEDVELTNGEDP
jgi:hypothetical protein